MKAELAIGSQALGWFEEQNWIAPTALEAGQKEDIQEGFNHLTADLPYPGFYRLEFRSSKVFGPNAFALPGGIIVLTDELVALSETNEEVLAVLAHELGHVDLRHTMRSVLQNSIVAATVATITADAATLSVAVAGLPMVLAQTQYSRQFETASDDYAFRLLKRKGYSPAAFATIMEKLDEKRGDRSSGFSYFSTHPLTDERVQAARKAAES
jgi:predicted Zn-dependent protease